MAVLIMSAGLNCVYAFSGDLDEYVALDIIGSADDSGSTGAEGDLQPEGASDNMSEPALEASRYTFAEALAREYRPDDGFFSLSSYTRFYIAGEEPPGEALLGTVRLMDSEFAAYSIPSSEPLPVVYGDADYARSGDIVISLISEEDFLAGIETPSIGQAYRIDVYDKVLIEACGIDGIWYALAELLEIAREHQLRDADLAADDAGADHNRGSSESADDADDQQPGILLERFHIKDAPDLKERAIMLDCGRKYYSKEWIESLIRRSSLQRYNALVLHFAEAEGIRVDSEVFPWLTEDIESLSTNDIREIVGLAHDYHMNVIPSFDTPGHNTFMVDRYAEYVRKNPDFAFTLDGVTYDKSIKGFGSIANHYSHGGETEAADYIGIDLTKDHAVAFTKALIDGYADFFGSLGCYKMDIGSDELLGWYNFELGGKQFNYNNRWSALEHWTKYARKTLGIENGSASDVLISYINDVAERLGKKGYTCRVFNDEIDINANQHVELDPAIDITYWFDADNTAAHFADKGHVMHNFMESWCFYVLRKEKGKDIMDGKYKTVNARNIFENWDPANFARYKSGYMRVPDDKLGGAYFAIWCDHPDYKSAETVWEETEMKTWANASKMWNKDINSERSGTGAVISYDQMKEFVLDMGGYAGYTGDPEVTVTLPAARELEDGMSGWQRRIVRIRHFWDETLHRHR